MSDIVERLRNAFPHGHENTDVPTYADDVLMHEAAAEIERMRAALQDLIDRWPTERGYDGAIKRARRALERKPQTDPPQGAPDQTENKGGP